ncbi:phosphotransferase family protein [Paenibacillus sacheonensis]|uniref:Phosphotransferase n=1 Tax=Paenibacillus sacheonensis TaxID=742054 RepID=A0A7X4YJY2_9BACL|nr:aminoglycoside phosphotransferase family protein [Paenibacillus sacheonensis]MBM7563875.1 aminoglycoside phosphotransferase (APT) family kinase protein [Paenibacillus sacheonensis]NBC67777.1 phosphotransferase [Paenibacillus sacheonensis]
MVKHEHDHPMLQQALIWAAAAVEPAAEVLAVKRLEGGVSSLVYEILLQLGEAQRAVVLRLFNNEDWLRDEPELARHEARSLRMAAKFASVPTPEVIAFDEHGSVSGIPAVLMSRLAGEVVLAPPSMSRWLDHMGCALAAIHQAEADPGEMPWTYFRYCDGSKLDTSAWSSCPEQWQAAAAIVTQPEPAGPSCFIHRDYHPTNILWEQDQVSGVVDWVNGCIGPAGVDVGHCRVNLVMLHGLEAADEFLAAYCRHAGDAFAYDPYWDLVSLIDFAFWEPEVYGGWTALGVTGLTRDLMIERLDDYLLQLLRMKMEGG